MKSISIYYVPEKEDMKYYNKKMEKAMLTAWMKKLFLPFAVMSVISIMYNIWVFISIFCFYIISVFTPVFAIRENLKSDINTPRFFKPLMIDFYEDHIEHIRLDGENGKRISEAHYRFSDVLGILETDKYFFFNVTSANLITIPKRAVNQQQYDMLKNLIENCFSGIYTTI